MLRHQAQYLSLFVYRRRMGLRQVVSLSGTSFVLLCIVLVLVAVPVGAQDNGGIPPWHCRDRCGYRQ